MPLLIGGATTSRVHTAVKIHPHYARGQAIYVNDASRAVGVVGGLLSPTDARRMSRRVRAEYARVADAHRARRSRQDAPAARQGPRQCARSSTGQPMRRRSRASSARAPFADYDLAELARYIDWTPFFQTWELKGRYPAILDDEKQGAAARATVRGRAGDAEAHRRRALVHAAAPSIGFWPADARRRRHPPLHRRDARATSSPPSSLCASSSRSATAGRISRSPISSRRWIAAKPITSAPSSSPPASRKRRSPSASSAPTTIIVDPGQGARRPLRRGVRRSACTQRVRREFWGYAPDETFAQRRADRRTLSRHPPGAGLPGPARPHREGDDLPPARRGGADRRQADRELRHVAGLLGVAASTSPTPRRIISASPRSSATRSRTMPRARA